jgi:hypothetical protein
MSFNYKEITKFLYLLLIIGILVAQPIFGVIVSNDNQSDNNNQSHNQNSSQSIVKDVCFSTYPIFCTHIKPPADIELPLIDMSPIDILYI